MFSPFMQKVVVGSICLAFLFLVKGCATIGAPDDYHYRTTVYLGDGAKTQSFSAVREVSFDADFTFPDLRRHSTSMVRGEAIPIVVTTINPFFGTPREKTYFALQDDLDDAAAFRALAPLARARGAKSGRVRAEMKNLSGEVELPRRLTRGEVRDTPYNPDEVLKTWPLFVTFDSPEDPETIRIVDPDDIGVSRVTVAITTEKPENKIGEMFTPAFWEAWHSVHARSLPEREADIKGRDAPHYQISPAMMRLPPEDRWSDGIFALF